MWRLRKIYIMPTVRQYILSVEKYFESWDLKIQGPRNYFLGFYVSALIDE